MLSNSEFGIREDVAHSPSKEVPEELSLHLDRKQNSFESVLETPNKANADLSTMSISASPALLNLEEIQAKFWREINSIPKKENADTNYGCLVEREEELKPRQKRKYVRKAKLMEELSEDEFEVKQKTFVVDASTTLEQLIDETIVDSRKQIKRLQIKEEIKNKNSLVSDDTESVSSFCNLKSDSSETNSLTDFKSNPRHINFHKKSVNMKNCNWEVQEVDKFYSLLEFLGADFSLISSFLKTKTIGQIKKKYHLELKKNPQRIHETLNRQSFKVCPSNYLYLMEMTKAETN